MAVLPDPNTSPAELTIDTVRAWLLELTDVERRMSARFPRWDARRRAGAYLRGLLSPVERKNGWQIAEANGDDTPYGVQHLLGRAVWDAEAVRDDLRAYLVEQQPGSLQDGARAGVPLSVREIRRLFWGLVLTTQQRVERILAWST